MSCIYSGEPNCSVVLCLLWHSLTQLQGVTSVSVNAPPGNMCRGCLCGNHIDYLQLFYTIPQLLVHSYSKEESSDKKCYVTKNVN